jgi:transposase
MYDAMKRHEIQILKNAGVMNREVVEVTGVSRRTVQRVASEPAVENLLERSQSRVGRPSKVDNLREHIAEILGKEPDLPTVEILHRVRERGYQGGKSALYNLVAALRSPVTAPVVRFEGLPGEFSQHDFGMVAVRYLSGKQERVHFFASRLKYSRWSYVEVVTDETVESLVRALLNSFAAFCGVPLVAVFDRPKTVVLRSVGSRVEWNPTFGQVALDYRFAPELCAPARANQKGAVENLVGWVKKSFFKVRRFHDREDLERQLEEWLKESNESRPSRATGVPPKDRIAQERDRLRPLAIAPSEYALRFAVMVGPTGMVEHQGIRYSMPPESIGFPATLYLLREEVRIVARKYEATHPRYPETGSMSFLSEHRTSMLAAVSGKRARLYFKRQQLLELGCEAEAFLTEIVHRHPRTWYGEVEILFEILQEVGGRRLRDSLSLAVSRRLFSARHVSELLRREVAG